MPFSGLLRYADPLQAGRHPFQTYMCFLCVVAGFPLLFGEPNAGSVEASLPGWMAAAWGCCLTLGAILTLVGSYWRRDWLDALTIERIGLTGVGGGAFLYGLIILAQFSWGGVLAGFIVLGFGLACLSRSRDIGKVIKRGIRLKEEGRL